MAIRPVMKKKRGDDRDSAIVINSALEEFLLISSQTVVSSNDNISTKIPLDDKAIGSIRRANFSITLSREIEIIRNRKFDGIVLLSRDSNKEYKYEAVEADEYDVSGMIHPSPSVATFAGGYSSRDGCFVVSCSNRHRRVVYFGGKLDWGLNRLSIAGFPTNIAKALHNICTALPELMPKETVEAINEYDELSSFQIYGQSNSQDDTEIRIKVNKDIFEDVDVKYGDFAVVRFELPKIPNGTCVQRVISVLKM